MIGIAEIDKLLALLIDGKKGHVPAVGRRRILDFAGSLVRNDLERHAELCGQGPAEGDGNAAIAVAVLDGELRRRRWRNGNGKPKLSVWSEFLQYRGIGHRCCLTLRRRVPRWPTDLRGYSHRRQSRRLSRRRRRPADIRRPRCGPWACPWPAGFP